MQGDNTGQKAKQNKEDADSNAQALPEWKLLDQVPRKLSGATAWRELAWGYEVTGEIRSLSTTQDQIFPIIICQIYIYARWFYLC